MDVLELSFLVALARRNQVGLYNDEAHSLHWYHLSVRESNHGDPGK